MNVIKLFIELLRAIASGKHVQIQTYEHRYLCTTCTDGNRFEMWSNDWPTLSKLIKDHEAAHAGRLPAPSPKDSTLGLIASRLEYKSGEALHAQPGNDGTEWDDRTRELFYATKEGRASAFAEAARILRGED